MTRDAHWIDKALAPQPDDSADVRWALETAVAMWLRGDRNHALSWVQNAVQSASNEGRHDRAYALGQILTQIEKRPLPAERPAGLAHQPTSTTQPAGESAAPHAQRAPGKARSRKSMMQTAPYQIPPDEVTHLLEPDSALLEACQPAEPPPPHSITDRIPDEPLSGPPAVLKPAPAIQQVVDRPRPPTIVRDALDATLTEVRPKPPVSREGAERTVVMTAEELMPPSVGVPSPDPATLGSPRTVLEPMRALRVAVQSGTGREVVVRLLDDGEQPEPGAQEALLLPLATKPTPG